ncbi:Alpha/Beta hydrolase protein [Dipodascopsis uninucleata]
MLIKETFHDIKTSYGTTMRVYIYHPFIPNFPKAKFPGVLVYSEIYQVTGPVSRLAKQIAGQGFIVAAPSVYHNFEGPEPLAYDAEGTDRGNKYKIEKPLESYDEDSKLTIDYLCSLPTCNGKIGATGMCLGGHLAYRAAFDPRVGATVCFFGTDIHSASLGKGKHDDSLKRAKDIKGELLMIFGTMDPHVPVEGRDLIRKTLYDAGVFFSFYEVAGAQHAFVRDENSRERYDPAVTKICLEMLYDMFNRKLKLDLGDNDGLDATAEDVC